MTLRVRDALVGLAFGLGACQVSRPPPPPPPSAPVPVIHETAWTHIAAEDHCTPALVDRVRRELRLDATDATCESVRTFRHGQSRLRLVVIEVGPVQDCPSGCFRMRRAVLLGDERVVIISPAMVYPDPRRAFASPLYELLRGSVPAEELGQYSFRTPNNDECSAPPVLTSEGGDVYWAFRTGTMECVATRLGQPTPFRFELRGEVRLPLRRGSRRKLSHGRGILGRRCPMLDSRYGPYRACRYAKTALRSPSSCK